MGNPDQPPLPDDAATVIPIRELVESGLLEKPPHKPKRPNIKRPNNHGTASGEIGERKPEK